jgi:hypothetical protein
MSLNWENPVSENNDEQVIYQIKVKGILDEQWSDWFDGMTVKPHSHEDTTLTGLIRDQAALHGLLSKIRDLGLTLLSVRRIDSIDSEEE